MTYGGLQATETGRIRSGRREVVYKEFDFRQVMTEYLDKYPEYTEVFNYILDKDKIDFLMDRPRTNSGFIAGGFVVKLLAKLPFGESDIDYWYTDKYTAGRIITDLQEYRETAKYITKQSRSAVTLTLPKDMCPLPIQIIRKYMGDTPKKIVGSFDLTICKCWTDLDKVYVHPKAIKRGFEKKELRDGQPFRPYVNLDRVKKYVALGFIPRGELAEKLYEAVDIMLSASPKVELVGPQAPRVLGVGRDQAGQWRPARLQPAWPGPVEPVPMLDVGVADMPDFDAAEPAHHLDPLVPTKEDTGDYMHYRGMYLPKFDAKLKAAGQRVYRPRRYTETVAMDYPQGRYEVPQAAPGAVQWQQYAYAVGAGGEAGHAPGQMQQYVVQGGNAANMGEAIAALPNPFLVNRGG